MTPKVNDLVLFPTGHWSHIVDPLTVANTERRTICGKIIPSESKGSVWDRQTESEPGCHICYRWMKRVKP